VLGGIRVSDRQERIKWIRVSDLELTNEFPVCRDGSVCRIGSVSVCRHMKRKSCVDYKEQTESNPCVGVRESDGVCRHQST